MSTPSELLPLAEQVLAWVADQRRMAPFETIYDNPVDPDDIRRIELMALVVREQCHLYALYSPTDGSST